MRKKKSICNVCNKSLTVTASIIGKCKCENIYCGLHRHPETHACKCLETFKENGRKLLAKSLPLVVADKLVKI
uniref:AN1-type domain-containing protein n=1 Tax=viral metagenome TaxID=1070528 RepID=A0A6C0J425_9ZZZZ